MSGRGRNDPGADEHRNKEKIVELTNAPTQFAAEAIVAQLEAEGIKATVAGDDAGGWEPGLGFAEGYRVMVFENDVPRAREIVGSEFD
jgi:hypothetical protein